MPESCAKTISRRVFIEPVPAELGNSRRKMNGVFEQSAGMGFESAALSGGLPDQFRLYFWPDVNSMVNANLQAFTATAPHEEVN